MANENRLIDANVIEKVMNERYKALAAEYGHYDHYTTGYGDALCVIEDAPTVDAVEVVRCKDCKYRHSTYTGKNYFCNLWNSRDSVKDSDFCSYGERREGE